MTDHKDGILQPAAPMDVKDLPEIDALKRFVTDPTEAHWRAAMDALALPQPAIQSDELTKAMHKYAVADADKREPLREPLRGRIEALRPLDVRNKRESPPARRWMVKDCIPAHRYGMLVGQGGQGKSRLSLQLARAVANASRWDADPDPAREWLKWRVLAGGPVVWCTWEDEHEEVDRRLGPEGRAAVGASLHVVDLAERGPLWAPAGSSGHVSTMAEITPVGMAVRQLCEEQEAALLILDPLAASFASNENDRGLVRRFVSDWDGWARDAKTTVLAIAHPPKDQNAGYSGSTDWQAASRWMAQLRPVGEKDDVWKGDATDPDLRVLEWTKGNYGPGIDPIYIRWHDHGFESVRERLPKPEDNANTAQQGQQKPPRRGHVPQS